MARAALSRRAMCGNAQEESNLIIYNLAAKRGDACFLFGG